MDKMETMESSLQVPAGNPGCRPHSEAGQWALVGQKLPTPLIRTALVGLPGSGPEAKVAFLGG